VSTVAEGGKAARSRGHHDQSNHSLPLLTFMYGRSADFPQVPDRKGLTLALLESGVYARVGWAGAACLCIMTQLLAKGLPAPGGLLG
jgi:hypothetical protein